MGDAKRISDRLKREREQSEREASLHRRAQTSEGDLLKAQSEISSLHAEVSNLKNWIDHHATEVPRLQAEVKRLTAGIDFWMSDHDKRWVEQMKRADKAEAKLDTAHNDAIEAAAIEARSCTDGCQSCAGTDHAIRALKCP